MEPVKEIDQKFKLWVQQKRDRGIFMDGFTDGLRLAFHAGWRSAELKAARKVIDTIMIGRSIW